MKKGAVVLNINGNVYNSYRNQAFGNDKKKSVTGQERKQNASIPPRGSYDNKIDKKTGKVVFSSPKDVIIAGLAGALVPLLCGLTPQTTKEQKQIVVASVISSVLIFAYSLWQYSDNKKKGLA